MGARFGARRSFKHNLHDRWGGRLDPHESRMYTIHSLEVRLRISVEDPQAGFVPCTSKVNPEASVVREGVSDPVSAESILHADDNVAAIVEIPHGDSATLTGATVDGFDDERVFSGVWRPWDAYEKGELGDRVRDMHDLLRKSHLVAASSLNAKAERARPASAASGFEDPFQAAC
jgi:hypothetical protein